MSVLDDVSGEVYIGTQVTLPVKCFKEGYVPIPILPDGTPCDATAHNVFPEGMNFHYPLSNGATGQLVPVIIQRKVLDSDPDYTVFMDLPSTREKTPYINHDDLEKKIDAFIVWAKGHGLAVKKQDVNIYASWHK